MAGKRVTWERRCRAVAGLSSAALVLAACGGNGGLGPGSTYTVGGTVSGLTGELVLQLNAGDDLHLSADGAFTFATALGAASAYVVSVRQQPKWQVCAVANGSGNASQKPVDDVTISCTAQALVSTLAGSGLQGADNRNGVDASFWWPHSLAFDQSGNLLVSEYGNQVERRISATGDVTTFAGAGAPRPFSQPAGLAVNSDGNTTLADSDHRRVYQITTAGSVSTFAGSGAFGTDDGLGILATFARPTGVAINGIGEIYIMQFGYLRKITPTGVVSTLAGSPGRGWADGQGAAAAFNAPTGLAIDTAGNLYVADTDNNRIRKITPAGLVSTLAGSGASGASDGVGTQASFFSPNGVAVDGDGDIYVADSGNSLVRRITPAGVVSTLAGQPGVEGARNGVGAAATFTRPYGVAVGPAGAVIVADTFNHMVRQITPVR